MQLFAIIANAERLTLKGRHIVEIFLQQQIRRSLVQTYLEIFDGHLGTLQGKADEGRQRKRVSVNSVKILRICTEINSELDQKQKYIVLIRLIEFAFSSGEQVNDQEMEFLSTVAGVFNISSYEYDLCLELAGRKKDFIKDVQQFLIINSGKNKFKNARHLLNDTLEGNLFVLYIKQASILFVRYSGNAQLTLNGHPLPCDTVGVLSPGSVIRGSKAQPVYYSDVMRSFLEDSHNREISLHVNRVEYIFKNGKKGLNQISFSASSGNLVGIMGGSGAGKSTLLNILNSNLVPAKGDVLINGVNIHRNKKKLEGIIGFVPQDDLLMEDLTVFQNIFYNSKLCFGNLTELEITAKANALLDTLGLLEIKDLRVGDVLNKTISGGQRKRLNIALELIRTPSVLFVDEPTSGLSSLDSENVMDLLKQLSISGKLVFVVIHQPSSDIFKLFDKLLILDIGGYPIYYGSPVDSLIYFKRKANYADADISECETCGNINPEQVFSIIESKVVDEFGNSTPSRKFSPAEWNEFYNREFAEMPNDKSKVQDRLKSVFKKPSRFQQLLVFVKRDVLSKLNNTQYLLINFLEAPLLAFILAFFLKYFKAGGAYIFRDNLNLTAYIFMSVIVALFMGLTVSAEEIIRDRKILKRESFLNLSRSSYLLSKVLVQFLISAIQTFSFVIIGNLIFGIKGMFFDYWLVLFSVSCFSNLLGLNISSAFDSVVTIYILIPFLIIPQIILSGLIVKFENLNPVVTTQSKVPVAGELMASRWAFEALAVNQFKNNEYQKHFFETDKVMSNASYKKNIWMQIVNDKIDSLLSGKNNNYHNQILFLKNELQKEIKAGSIAGAQLISVLNSSAVSEAALIKLKAEIENIKKYYTTQFKNAERKRDSIVSAVSGGNPQLLTLLEKEYANENLKDWVMNNTGFETPVVINNNELTYMLQPVYHDGNPNSFIRAQYFVSRKNVFGKYFDTYPVNIAVIWFMTLSLSIMLYYDVFKKIINAGNVFENRKK